MSGLSASLTVSGIEAMLGNISTRQVRVQMGLHQAILRYALLIERIAKSEYVPVVTGRLKASIGGQSAPPPMNPGDAFFEKKVRGDVIEVWVGSNVVYAPMVEFGRDPAGSHRAAIREAYAKDLAATPRSAGSTRRSGNGRHGPFLGPAVDRARELGGPILVEQLRAALFGL